MFLGKSYDRVLDKQGTDPCNYNKALQDKDADLWQKVMMFEMKSMYSNQVWDLVEPSNEIKSIRCKWIYKKNRGADEKVETFKARLVSKSLKMRESHSMYG